MDTSCSTTITTDSCNDQHDPQQQHEQEPETLSTSDIQSLHQSLTLPGDTWMDVSTQPLTSICLCKVSDIPSGSKQPIVITHCLTVNGDLTWSLYVHNHHLNQQNCTALQSIPQTLSLDALNDLLQRLDHLHVCCGQHFVSMVNAKKGKKISSDGKVTASVDQYAPVTLNRENYQATVRTGSCELVSNSQKCSSCKCYRDTLRTMYNRWCKRRATCELSDTSSHSNERYLNTPEKKAKMASMFSNVS